jgi:hypothetical protein
MTTIRFFRDSLAVDDTLFERLGKAGVEAHPGDTLVLGAASCTLTSLSAGFSYVILADTLTTGPSPITVGAPGDPAPAITVLANSIVGRLDVTVTGVNGADGQPGANGDDGEIITGPTGKPVLLPGADGEPGEDGGDGGGGGAITIRFASAATAPTASAPGGPGGAGGAGGAGGSGKPPGTRGRDGKPGRQGPAGPVSVAEATAGHVFDDVDLDTRTGWSAYRTEVGEFLFRRFDPASQLHALAELDAALELDPTNTRAATLRQRLIQQQTPGGAPRDLDMAPDVKDVSAGLLGETQLVLSEFLAVQATATQDEIAAAARDQLSLVVRQLADRMAEAELDVVSAGDGVRVADAERNMFSTQVTNLQNQIFDLRHKTLSLGEMVTTLGAVAEGVIGVATGVGAIVAIPGALAAVDNPESGIRKVLKFLADGNSFWDDKDIGGDLSDLMSGGKDAITNFSKVYDELSLSGNDAAIKQLAMQMATLNMQLMVANLRGQQARDQLVAAQARVTDYAAEIGVANGLLGRWNATKAFLDAALGVLLNVARQLAGLVAEDVFVARRALEIYQLEDASSVRFDYGLLHPDVDRDLVTDPLKRVQLSLQSVTTLPTDVITWQNIFVRLNEAQTAGFDVVHPVIEVVIDDTSALDQLRGGGGLRFSVGIGPSPASATIPANIFELKVGSLELELIGASATASTLVWVQHSGHWLMARRPTPAIPHPPAVEFTLFPHVEAFNLKASTGVLRASIPAQPASNVDPGPPFSFWGRGALADWALFADASATALDMSGLSAVKLSIGCIGLVPQGTVVPPVVELRPEPVPLALPEGLDAEEALVNLATS